MDALYSIVRFFVAGGAFMYPILIVFAVGAAIAIERYITLTMVRRRNEGMWSSPRSRTGTSKRRAK
jgi:biopolymer transport protein ExbB